MLIKLGQTARGRMSALLSLLLAEEHGPQQKGRLPNLETFISN